MKKILTYRWHWLLPVLAVFVATTAFGQSIVYVQMPPTVRSSEGLPPGISPVTFPEDALGTCVSDPLPIIINGQTICTFITGSWITPGFYVTASGTGAIIGQISSPSFPDYMMPLAAGTLIGPDAAGYDWTSGGLLSASIASDTIQDPVLMSGAFCLLESAYMGFSFQQDGDTYYGWIHVGSPYATTAGTLGWVYDYAYSTDPNMPIFAGMIPELGTWVLLGMGSLTLFIIRRKRQAT